MKETLIIGGWWVLFGATHLLLSSARVRPKLVDRLGERPFQAAYSLVALATFVPLCVYYARHKHVGPQLWVTLEPYLLVRDFNIAGMLLAFVLLLGGVLDRPPSSLLAQGTPQAYGMTRITRHPVFAAAFLFGLAHLAVIGALSDLVFFGGFVVFAWLGAKHQDQRKSRDVPGYAEFQVATSFVPFAAIVGKKQPFPGRELRWGMILVALIVFYVVRFYHPALFGGVLMTL
jgi:uncharacterized membrane protein